MLLSASFVSAQDSETEFPSVPGVGIPNASTTFPQAVKYLFNLSMFVGVLLVLGVLVWSGFRYETSGNNPAVIGDVKKKIYSAFLGLLILLSSYLILTTINPGLMIFNLHLFSFSSTSTTPVIPNIQASTTFREIPLGTIIEDLLAGNASTTAHSELRCYKYDSEGDTVDINNDGLIDGKDALNYNAFYCLSLINEAFEVKVEKFVDKFEKELKPLLDGCECSSCAKFRFAVYSQGCETKWPTGECGKCGCHSSCDSHCSCCGSARGEDEGCPKIDPCPASVRKKLDCKRQEIKQLLDGGELFGKDGKPLCETSYDPEKDPKNNPKMKFLTLQAAADRAEVFHQAFSDALKDLREAESIMKSPYGERLTLQEFYDFKTKTGEKVEKVEFKSYGTANYCQSFNCKSTDSGGLCKTCELNSEKRMCRMANGAESYVTTGDNATFYLANKEEYRTENIVSGEKCTIDPKVEKTFQTGLIPIGETVDEAEKFATKVLLLYDFLSETYQKTMSSISYLLDSPDKCNCDRCSNTSNCGPRCGGCNGECPAPAFTSCSSCNSCSLAETQQKKDIFDETGLAWKWDVDCCGWSGYVPDMEKYKNLCPIEDIDQEMKNINNEQTALGNYRCCNYATSTDGKIKAEIATTTSWKASEKTTQVNITKSRGNPLPREEWYYKDVEETVMPEPLGYLQVIEMVYQKMEDLFNGKNLEQGDLNRCQILDKLTISRDKMMKCITGFGVPDKESMAKEMTLSCSSAWDAIRSQDKNLIILPKFPNPVKTGYLNCYPYNSVDLTSAQKLLCLQNRNSPECASTTYYLLDNYYCCRSGE